MAKRKGKAKRRIKNWQQRYRAGEDIVHGGPQRQKLGQRAVKLPPSRAEAPEEHLDDLPKRQGMVEAMHRRVALVRCGSEHLLCAMAKTFRAPEGSSPLVVGDEVTVAMTRPEHADGEQALDRDRADGLIIAREPRRTVLARHQPRSRKRRDEYGEQAFDKVIVANADVLMIVAATREPPLHHGLIDRFLIAAERGELTPLLVVNKVDLGPPADGHILAEFAELDVEILLTSAETDEGVDRLSERLTGCRSVLAGASGVGKTSLVNRLIPDADAQTRTVRDKDRRGRHTTTSTVCYDLPCGGMLIDTPGIRELGLAMDPAELPWFFPEIEQIAPQCRFNDCTHTHEPDCAVQAAVETGELPPRRYHSYLRILESMDENW